jgi:hypothetical protein
MDWQKRLYRDRPDSLGDRDKSARGLGVGSAHYGLGQPALP